MTEVERIEEQMTRAFEANAWSGPSVRELLHGVDAQQATRKPLAAAHSVWELVLHMTTWKDVVARRLGGEPIREVPPEIDFPKVAETTEAAWTAALDRLSAAHERLRTALRSVGDEELDQPPPEGVTQRYVLLHGIIQHDLYHAGQIAVLKKG